MPEAWIVEAVRSPIGKHGGALASVRPDDLLAHVLSALMERSGVPKEEVEDVYAGCANQAGEDNRNVARMALLLAGFPVEVAGCTVNRLCGSGLEAVAQAARAIWAGEGQVYVGGGVESMSRAPYAVPKPERGFPTGNLTMYDTTLGWRFVNPRIEALYGTESMGETAENLAEMYGIPREEQDRFALLSHKKAVRAWDEGRFLDEVVPVPVRRGKEEALVSVDEGPRRDTSLEKLAALRPVFREGGTVTAGNASPLNDGAAAVLLVSDAYAKAHGLRPLARIRAIAVAGVPPRIMGIGPVPATKKALERAGLSLKDLGLIELNEAFAAQSLAVLREWGLSMEDERLNPNGGAIALGHPLGASGPGSSPPWSTRCGGGGSSGASPPCASAWARGSPWWWKASKGAQAAPPGPGPRGGRPPPLPRESPPGSGPPGFPA
jgi:acetyl-CoA acyltransferase